MIVQRRQDLGAGIWINHDTTQLNSTPINFLQKLRQEIAIDEQTGYAAPGQVQLEHSLLDALTALQGTAKGLDRLAGVILSGSSKPPQRRSRPVLRRPTFLVR